MRYKRIMIFGSPGSGKSTLGLFLSRKLDLPLFHNDKNFYIRDWIERNVQEFFDITFNITQQKNYIIDGNCTRMMLERDCSGRVDMIIYLDVARSICLWRVIKRFVKNKLFGKEPQLHDRAPGCGERLSWNFLKNNLWTYRKKTEPRLLKIREKY